jgi:hypothetical protein
MFLGHAALTGHLHTRPSHPQNHSGFEAPLELAGERLAKVRFRHKRLSRRQEYGAQLRQRAGNELVGICLHMCFHVWHIDPIILMHMCIPQKQVLFHFLTCVGRLVLKAASWALCPFSDPPPNAAAAGAAGEGGQPHDPFAGSGAHPLQQQNGGGEGDRDKKPQRLGEGVVDLEGEFLGPQPNPEGTYMFVHAFLGF